MLPAELIAELDARLKSEGLSADVRVVNRDGEPRLVLSSAERGDRLARISEIVRELVPPDHRRSLLH